MTTPRDPETEQPGKDSSADEVEADIERTRNELGQTIDALSAKFDVKTQMRNKKRDTKQRATEQAEVVRARGRLIVARAKDSASDERGKIKPVLPAGAAAVLLAAIVVAIVVWRKRR